MSSPDQLPVDPETTERSIKVRLDRDTLILFGAVGFLGIAFLLAAIFGSPAQRTANTPTAVVTTQVGDIAAVATQDVAAATAITQPTRVVATSLPEPTLASVNGYPAPAQVATATQIIANQTLTPPVFAPTVAVPTAQLSTETVVPTLPPPPTPEPVVQPSLTPIPVPTVAPPANPPAPTVPLVANSANGPSATPRPTSVPITMLRGTNYWKADKSPYIIDRNLAIAPGAVLIIDPGVEIRIAPGIAISTEGKLYALGKPGQPVRFIASGTQRWDGIFGRAGSEIIFEQTEIRGGGAGGTVIGVERGTLGLRGVRITDNGGHIRSELGNLEVRDSEISGNDMPYGAALEATFNGGLATIINNRIGGNRMATGAPQVLLSNESNFEGLKVDVQRNLLIGQDGPNLTLATGTSILSGNVLCNALLNGANGLSIRSETVQTPIFPLTIRDNAIDDHIPPIIPIYLKYGIGRGATSEVQVDMRNNWWGSSLGPYEPDRWADGRGDSVGENIAFDPWLPGWPACAPRP